MNQSTDTTTAQDFYNEEYFLGTSGTRGNFSLLDLDMKFIDRTQTVIDYFDLKRASAGVIAEVGCGTAPFYRLVTANAEHTDLTVICSDITESGIRLLEDSQKPIFSIAGAEKLPYDTNSLLGVVEWDVLEHIKHPEQAIAEAHRVLKPGGFLHIVCPNPNSWQRDNVDPEKDPYRRDNSHVFPPIVTAAFLKETLGRVGFDTEIFTRGFEGQDGKNQTGIDSMKHVAEDESGTHLVAFAKKSRESLSELEIIR